MFLDTRRLNWYNLSSIASPLQRGQMFNYISQTTSENIDMCSLPAGELLLHL